MMFLAVTAIMVLMIILVSFGASTLTFISGFGLGTLLLPVFGLWFPIKEAVIMTAVVHLLNNLFKLVLVNKYIDRSILLRFGVPALLAAVLGSLVLNYLNGVNIAYPIKLGPFNASLRILNVVLGMSIIIFGTLEFFNFGKKPWGKNSLLLGGLLSGFFGGLSGHQGALRSAFLMRYPMTKETFIATGVGIACAIDLVRLMIYSSDMIRADWSATYPLVAISVAAAILGALLGNQYLKKTDIGIIKKITAVGIVFIGLAILLGIV